jgi:arabinose-5-phosphate isomerase
MRIGERVPVVQSGTSLTDSLLEISKKQLGMVAVVDSGQTVLGVLTDGDVRRLFERGVDVRTLTVDEVMSLNPRTITQDVLAVSAVELMQRHHISQVLVVDDARRLNGALNIHDLFAAKVV